MNEGFMSLSHKEVQGRRQDVVKGGADARREMPMPLQSEVWGPLGVWGLPEAYDHMF